MGDFEGAVDQEFADTFAQLDQLDLTQPDPTPTADPSAALGFAEEYPDVAAMIDEAMPASAPAQPAGEPISGFVDEFSTAFSQSFRHTERGKLGQQMIEEGSLSPEELASLDEINLQDQTEAKQAQIDADQELYIGTDAMGRVAGNIAGMAAANTLDPVSLKYTAAGAVAGALVPIPGGAWGGAAIGTAIGNFMAMWNTEAGNKYLDLKEMRDPKTGGVIPDEIAADAADDFGFHQAMIEMTGLAVTVGATVAVSAAGLFGAAPAAAVGRVVTGEAAKGFLKGVGEKLLASRLAQATTKGLEFAAKKGGRALSIPASMVATGVAFSTPEAFEEFAQAIDEDRMENFAKAATNEAIGTEFEQVDWPTMISHGLDAFTAMWGGGFALGMVGMAGGHLIRHGVGEDQSGIDGRPPNTAAAMAKMAERTEEDIAQTRAERQEVADQAAGTPSVTVDELFGPEDDSDRNGPSSEEELAEYEAKRKAEQEAETEQAAEEVYGSEQPRPATADEKRLARNARRRAARRQKKIDKALGIQTTIDDYISASNPTADVVVRELNEEEQARARQNAVAGASAAEQADAEAEVSAAPTSQQANEEDPFGAGPPIAVGIHRGDGFTPVGQLSGAASTPSSRKALYQALTFFNPTRDKVTGLVARDDTGKPEIDNQLRREGYRIFIYKDEATGARRFGFAQPTTAASAQIDEVGRRPTLVAYDEEGLQVNVSSKGVRFLNEEESELVYEKLELHAALVYDAEAKSTREGLVKAHDDLLAAVRQQDAEEEQLARNSDASLVFAVKGTQLTPEAVERLKGLWRTASNAEKAAGKGLIPANYLRMDPEERRNFIKNTVRPLLPKRSPAVGGTISIFVPRATDIESNVELNDRIAEEFRRDLIAELAAEAEAALLVPDVIEDGVAKGPGVVFNWKVNLSGVDQRGFIEKTKEKLRGRKAVSVESVQAVERSAKQFRKLIGDIHEMGAGALWADAHNNTARGNSRTLDGVDRALRQILQRNRVLLDDRLGVNAKDGFGRVNGALRMVLALDPADIAVIAEDEQLRKIVKVGMNVPGGYEVILHDAHLGATARKIAIVRLLIATGQIVYPSIGESVIDTAAPTEPAAPMVLQRVLDEKATPEMRAEIRRSVEAQEYVAGIQRPLDLQDTLEKLEAIQAEALAEIEEMEKNEFLVWDEEAGMFHVRQREGMTDSELEAVLTAQAGPRINIWEGGKSAAVQALREVCQKAGLMPQVFEDKKGRVDLILNYVSEEMENEIRRRVNQFAPGRTVVQTTSDPLQTHGTTVTTGYEPGRDRETGDALPEYERQGLVVEKEQTLGAYRFSRSGHQLMISYSKRALHGTGIKAPEATVSKRLASSIEEVFGTDRNLIRNAQIRILTEWKKGNEENIKKYGIKVGLEKGKITFSATLSRNASVVIAARLRQFKYQATRVQTDTSTGRTTFEVEAVGVDPEVSAVRRLMLAIDEGIEFERVITAQPKAADAITMARARLAHITDAMWEGVKKLKPEAAKSGKLKMRKARVLLWEQTRRALFTDARNFDRNDDRSEKTDGAGRPIKLRYIENVRGRFAMVGSNIRDAAEKARTGLYGEEAEFQQAITVLQSEGIDIGGEGFESPYQFSIIETEDWVVIPNRLSPGALTMLSSLIRSDENGYFVDRAAAGDVAARKDATTEAKPIGMAPLDEKAVTERKGMISQVQELFTALNNPEGMGELARRQLRFLGYVIPEKFIHENEDGSLEEIRKGGQRAAAQAVFANGDGKIFMVNASVHRGWMDSGEGASLFVGPPIKQIGSIPSEHQRETIVMMKPGTAQVAAVFKPSNLHVFGMEGLTEKEFRAAKAVTTEAERTGTEPDYPTATAVPEEVSSPPAASFRFRPNILKAPMSFNMSAENLRPDLRKKYPRGVSTAQLMLDGLRTSTTRKPDQFDYAGNGRVPQVGDVIEFSKVEGVYWLVEDVVDPNTLEKDGFENLSRREGWSVEFLRRYVHKNKGVLSYSLRQLSEVEVEERRQKQAAEAGAPLRFRAPATPERPEAPEPGPRFTPTPGENLLPADGDVRIAGRIKVPEGWVDRLLEEGELKQESIVARTGTFKEPRLSTNRGDDGLTYTYAGRKNVLSPWTETLLQVKKIVEQVSGVTFNSAIINQYRTGSDSIGFHADDEKELGKNPTIASVSFGESRTFILRHKKGKYPDVKVVLKDGDVLVMSRETQHNWTHGVPKEQGKKSRVNITFRKIFSKEELDGDPMGAGLGQTPESATDNLNRTAGKAKGHKATSRRLWSKQFATLAKSMSQLFGGRLFAANGTKETQTRYINGKRVVDAMTNWQAMNRIARFFQVPSLKVSGPNRQWFSDLPTLNEPNPVAIKHTGRYRRLYAGGGQVMVWNSEAFGAFIHELGHHIAYGLKIPGLKVVYPGAPSAPNAEPRIIDTLEHLSIHAAGYYGKILGELRTAAETYGAGVDSKGNPLPASLSGMTEQQIYQEGLAQFLAAYILDQNGCAQVFPNTTKWMDDICAADKGAKGRMPLGRAFEETRRIIAKQAARTIWEAGYAGISQLSYYARMDFWERRVADAMKVWQQTQEFNEYVRMYGPAEAIRIKTNEFRYEVWRQLADNGYIIQQISDMAERTLGQRLAHDVNPLKLWRIAKGSDGRADKMLRFGFTSTRNKKTTKHRGFYQIIEPINEHNTRMEFDLFLKDLRILEDHFSGRYGDELTHNVRLAENRLIEIEDRLSKYGYVPVSRRGNLRSGGQWSYVGMTPEEKAKAQLFKSVADELSKFNLGMLERMAENGMIPWKTVTRIMSAHTMYSPLIMYIDNAVGNYLSQASIGHGATLYATTFSNYDAEIQSPLESMMQNVVATERTIAATKVNVAIANLSTMAGMSQYISAISYQELMLSPDSRVRALWQKLNDNARANGQQLDPALEGLITQIFIESPDVQSVIQAGLSKVDGDRIIAIPRRFLSQELQEKANMIPGADPEDFDGSIREVAFFRVSPDLHDLMTNASHSLYHHGSLAALNDRDIDNYLFKFAAASSQWLRWGATTTLRFMLFNQIWDLTWAHFATKSGLRVFPKLEELAKGNVVGSHFIDAWKEVYGLGPQYQKFLESGAGMAWLAAGDYDVTKQAEWEMRHPGLRDKLWSLASWSFPSNAVKMLQWMSRMTEESTRVAEFLAAQEQLTAQGGLTPEEIITEAAFRAREITVDFRRGGNMMQKWNRYEPFLNAQTQGAVRLLEVMDDLWGVERGDDGKIHFKNADSARRIRAAKLFFAYSFFPSVMLYALNHDDDEYAAVPEWEKRDFFHIPIHGRVPSFAWAREDDVMGSLGRRWTPMDQYVSFITIPKPRNLNGPTDLFIGFLDWLKKEDPAAHSKTMREMVGEMGTDVRNMAMSLLLPQVAQTTLETFFDYSLFKEAPIEGQWKKQKLPSERATPFNSKFAIYLSRALEKYGGPGLSAPMIDYWIKGHFGGMGAQATGFLDATVIGAGETIFGTKTPGPERSFGKTVPLLGELWDSMARSNRMVGSKAMVDFYESYGGYLAASSAWKSAGSNARRAELISMYPEYLTKSGPVASLSRRMKWGKNKLDDTMELVNKTFASNSLTPRQKQLRAEYLYNQAGLIASMAVTGARPSQQQKEKMQALKTRALKRAS